MNSIFYILLSIVLLLSENCFAQTRQIIGKVTDAKDNLPLQGVNVVLLPSQRGTITDVQGNFTLSLKETDKEQEELMVSFIGMKTIKVPLTAQNSYYFKMEDEINELMQVVVTSSYGTKKLKEEVVGSIATIQAKDIQVDQAFESVDKMLDGQVAGVSMEIGSSPLDPVKINIRGQGTLTPTGSSTLTTSSQPLIIIDGVIMSEESGLDNELFDGGGTFSEDFLNPLAQIAPEDIESIVVLKDAAAVGVYGADGSNGVILITTKSGEKGKARFHVTSQHGISKAVNRIKYLNGEQYSQVRNEYLKNTGALPIPYNGVDTDWFGLLNGDGSFHKYSVDASGGGKYISYRLGVSYLDINEPQKGNGSDQYRLSSQLGYDNGKLRVNLKVNPSLSLKDNPNVYYSYAFAPDIPAFKEDGAYAKIGVTGLANPFAAIEQNRNQSETYGLLGSLSVDYEIMPKWSFSSLFGMDYKDKEQDRYFSGENESGQNNGTFSLNGVTYPKWGRRLINYRQTTAWNWQGRTNFSKQFNDHHYFDVMGAMELRESKTDVGRHMGTGFVNPNVVNPVSAALRDDNPKTEKDERLSNQSYRYDIDNNSRVSILSQLNYNYKKKYFVLMNFRRDQSSVFGDDSDVAYNGGFGTSWAISKESFLSHLTWIDLLKIKYSLGTTGNSRIGSYRSKGIYLLNEDNSGYNNLPYATSQSAPNANLGWERNIKQNIGIDFNFLLRYSISVEYFRDHIKDMISDRDVPIETGYASVQINGSDMVNKGIEIALSAKIIDTKSYKWNVNLNLATLHNEITSVQGFGDDLSSSYKAAAIKEGYSTTAIWGVKYVGVDPATGRELFEKDGKIYDGATYHQNYDNKDWEPIGNTQADFYGGYSTSLSYKNKLRLSIRGSFKYGADKSVKRDLISNYRIMSNRNLSVNALDYWQGTGDFATQPVPTNNDRIIQNSSKFIYDTSNIKISNISLSYIIPVQQLNMFLKSLSVNADVTNAFVFYKNKSPKGKNGIREFMYTYPQSRTWSFGIKATF